MVKTAIVILNWNGEKLLQQFLPSVIKYSDIPDCKVFVADNASTDNSLEILKQQFPQVGIITLSQNYGFAGGYNKSVAEIDAENILLLNSDVEVTENWLAPLVDHLDNNEDVAAVMPKILAYNNKSVFEYAGASGGFIDKFGYPFCRGRIFFTVEDDKNQYDTIYPVFWTTGACMLIRKNIFVDSGGFDADFFAHMEEIDLCWRIKNMGFTFACVPQSVVYHVGGATLGYLHPKKLYLNFRNNLFLLYKNLPDKLLLKTMCTRYLFDVVSLLQFALKFEFKNVISVIRAHVDFIKMIKKMRRKRHRLKYYNNTYLVHAEMYPRSIIIDYFARKKKTFNELGFFSHSDIT